jgi:hypothetical protein
MDLRAPSRSVWRAGLLGAVLATVINGAVFLTARAADVSFVVRGFGSDTSPRTVTLVQVILNSFAPFIVGTAVAAFVVSRGHRVRSLQLVGAAVALISLGGPATMDADGATRLLLASMHVVAGAMFVLTLQACQRAAPTDQARARSDTSAPAV